ncbi:NlpC/P60 family protein [Lysobacter pythonis]|uniref:NlpC/P60 family protein n=1 Tax=Solilutibacter pythonis TaxID=2483112 RepID=A0A3M2I364_9GAMM|nr:C40 family peptidase [Lysobacter pythonis]RMH92937.1 NlpC/P60 family protein [Lysobacter pythonis]
MKSKLLPGRSGAQQDASRKTRFLPVSAIVLLAALSAPAMAATDLPAVRGTDVQTLQTAAASKSVMASFDNSAVPDNIVLMPMGNAAQVTNAPTQNRVQKLLKGALALLGTPYRWGGTGTDGFDCSGLVGYVFRTALGVELPRVSREMATRGERVNRDQMNEGDLVFFSRSGRRIDHVGIYLGNGQFVHAPRTGKDVMVSRMDTGYWSGKFMQARRVATHG